MTGVQTCALPIWFAMMELAFDIPDEVMSHPVIQEMVLGSADMIVIANVSDIHDQISSHTSLT